MFAWDYFESDLNLHGVTHFETSVDGGLGVDVGLVPVPNEAEAYYTPVPSTPTGSHTFRVSACNAGGCSLYTTPFDYVLGIFSPPANVRVIPVPED